MKKKHPGWWAARVVHQILARAGGKHDAELQNAMRCLSDQQDLIARCWRRCELAIAHGWHLAAAREQGRLLELLPCGLYHLTALQDVLRRESPTPPPDLRQLLGELTQLDGEFDHVLMEPKRNLVAVQTECITLEGIVLGRFQIELHLDRFAERPDSTAIDVVAMDPNPPRGHRGVTHPHVSDQALCAGDASTPLRNALKEGRLCDAFLLVRSVLRTYNGASAYVPLDDWDGVACADCGYTCRSDDLYYCPACHRDFCESCVGICDECDDSYCCGCLEREEGTRRSLCPTCRALCPQCDQIGLASDIEAHGLCARCVKDRHQQQQEETQHEDQRQQDAPAHAA